MAGSVDLTSGFATVTSAVGSAWTMITGNPYLMVFIAVSLIGVGITVFKKIKRAAK